MVKIADMLRDHGLTIWKAAVDAARPREVVRAALEGVLREALTRAKRILVVGAGKAGVAMSAAVEEALAGSLDRIEGVVNVPDLDGPSPLRKIVLHGARPVGSNQPTARGVEGAERILKLVASAGPEDVCLCLISGGGSALLPAPAEGVTLEDKQQVTRQLHACGATINEMNAVRKHLSRIKGGRLAQAFHGKALFSLVISDVVGDPLDVIASGPTAPDPTTFADALAILDRYQLTVPRMLREHLERGERGEVEETMKGAPPNVSHLILANNAKALAAAARAAERLGYSVVHLGSRIEGDTSTVALVHAGITLGLLKDDIPPMRPVCVLSGGETTVTLPPDHGKGGRNQEFVLTAAHRLVGNTDSANWLVLSGGTDGEDGPTDAAGAMADVGTFQRASARKLDPRTFLSRHDAYSFFDATGDLIRTGLTQTNVMDVRVVLVV
jgi:hydroxypyruvate reductase/glycerate 2-kinase